MSSGDGEAPSGCGSPTARRVRRPLPCGVYAALVFDPGGRPAPRRCLRPWRTVFAFGAAGVTTTFFLCAIFAATAFGGRPGPPGRHLPRAALRRRRRPFVAFRLLVETLPSNDWIAEPTSRCTMSLITVTRLRCFGILPPFGCEPPPRWRRGKRPL